MPISAPYRSLQVLVSPLWPRFRAVLGASAIVCAGCATAPAPPQPTPSHAQPPRADSVFAAVEDELRHRHGAEVSGFRLLHNNLDALTWRLAVIDSALHSLDLQYYVWFGDKVGQLLLARAVAAATTRWTCSITSGSATRSASSCWHAPLPRPTVGSAFVCCSTI